MRFKYLNELADIVVSIDECKNISDEKIVGLTDRSIRVIAHMKLLGLNVGALQEIFAGMQIMCGNRVVLIELIDMAHEEIAQLLGAAYSRSRYQLGREYASLDAHGTSETTSLFATYPLILSQTNSLLSTLTYENKKLNDRMDSVLTETDKQVQLVSMGLSGERLDTLNGGGRNSFDAVMYVGHLNMDATARIIDDLSTRSNGDFIKATYMLNRLQRITDQDTFSMTLFGQWAGKNLNSSEKYSLGGSYGVRAYPQGEASGDMGSMLNLELAHHFTPQLRGLVFYDYGHIRVNRDAYSMADNSRTLAGAGFGVNASLHSWQFDSYVAWPTQGGTPLSEPASSERIPRLWVQMSGDF